MQVIKDVVLLDHFKDRLGREYNRAEVTHQVKDKTFYGELDTNGGLQIDLARISHIVENITVTDAGVTGDIRLLNTPMGMIADGLLSNGIKLLPSIRATGVVSDNVYVSDLAFVTFDLIKVD